MTAGPAAAAPKAPEPRIDLTAAKAVQKGRSLVVVIKTDRKVNLKRLHRFPAGNAVSPFLCLSVMPARGGVERRLCLGGRNDPRRRIGLSHFDESGDPVGRNRTLKVKVKRPRANTLVATLFPGDAGLNPRRYRWRLTARQGGKLCRPGRPARRCYSSIPGLNSTSALTIRKVVAVGCTTGSAGLVTHGPRGEKVVALTFDDGPSTYTPGFLEVLRRKKVRATFFVIGVNLPGRSEIARRIVTDGHEIANHSWQHDLYPGYADLHRTSQAIQAASGFKPCSFRPPGGAQNGAVVSGAAAAGMRTILWDVDPFDWRLPGTDSIFSTVTGGVRPGSIVLSHDGGGPRSQTLAALPRIIDNLRARGYRFTTVTELLGGKFRYGTS